MSRFYTSKTLVCVLGVWVLCLIILFTRNTVTNAQVSASEFDATPTPLPQEGSDLFALKSMRVADDPTSFMVKWKTKLPTHGWIEYGTGVDAITQVAYDVRGQEIIDTFHSVVIKDLQPNTIYFFVAVVDGRKYDNGGVPFQIDLSSLDGETLAASNPLEQAVASDVKSEVVPSSAFDLASPDAVSALQCDQEVYYGVQHCTDNNGTTHVILVNLNDSRVRVQTVLSSRNGVECNSVNHKGKDPNSNCDAPYPGETLRSMLNRYKNSGAVAVINTDYFGLDYDHGAQGLAVRNGIRLDGQAHDPTNDDGKFLGSTQPSLAFSPSKVATIGVAGSEQTINNNLSSTYYNTVGGAPIIVKNGGVTNTSCTYPYPGNVCGDLSQSAAGLTADGRLILIAAKKNAADIGSYLSANFSVHSAIKFDGGGSARVAWLDSNGVTQSWGATGEDRPVVEGLLIFSSKKSQGLCLVESPHPYTNSYNSTWTLTNPDSNATATRVHFSRIETESGYDYVYVRDANNNQVSRFEGNGSDLWSAAVPGRTVKIQLTSDSSVIKWGFCVDRIETINTGQAPAPPSNLRATALDSTRIQLTWGDNSNNESGFKIYDGSIFVATTGANAVSYTATGLAPGSYHCYHIYAYNNYGNSAWTDWACTTIPTGVSSNLARGRPAYATSQESATYAPIKGNDGSTSTRWSSQWSATTKTDWWWVDLGTQTFDRVVVRWEAAYAAQYYIGWSNDGVTYYGYSYTATSAGTYTHNLSTRTARYVGIQMNRRAPCCGNYSFWELEVYRTTGVAAASQGENAEESAIELVPDGDLITFVMEPDTAEENQLFLPFIQH